jgi:hypothetical protein
MKCIRIGLEEENDLGQEAVSSCHSSYTYLYASPCSLCSCEVYTDLEKADNVHKEVMRLASP